MFFRKKKGSAKPATAAKTPMSANAGGALPGLGGAEPQSLRGAPTTQFLTGEASKDRRVVQVLLETIARVSRSRDLESLLTYVVDSSVKMTGAERGLLILSGDDGAMRVRTGRMRGEKDIGEDARFSTSVAGKVLEEGQPVRATVHSESEALELGKSVFDLKLRAVMCVPLTGGENEDESPPRGVLYVDSRAATRNFGEADLALFAALAQQISIAMDNAQLHIVSLEKLRMQQSLELARVIQSDLMPEIPRGLEGWDVHGWYRPADEAAGDFYDFVKAKDGRLAIVVGDATGHGIGPALITATTQGSLRSSLRLIADPGQVVTLVNQDLSDRIEDGRFLTLYLALLGADGGVTGLNAGHALPFVWRKAPGTIEMLRGGGPALGMIEDFEYDAQDIAPLAPGDVLVVYTDGLSEARNLEDPETLFGEDGVAAAIESAAKEGKDARGILTEIVERAMELSGDAREDDITLVVARRT